MTIDIDELERLAAAATPGDWAMPDQGRPHVSLKTANGWDGLIATADAGDYARSRSEGLANAAFIAASRTAIPELIARVRELEAENLHLQTLNKGAHEIVSRIWTIFGTPSYEELAGPTIYDLVQDALARAEKAEAEVERLRKVIAGCDWYWPIDDTSSDTCADGPWQIAENYDLQRGEILAYARGGVIETRFYAFLDPAEDADSDDNFEVDEATEEAAVEKIAAELSRRAAINGDSNG